MNEEISTLVARFEASRLDLAIEDFVQTHLQMSPRYRGNKRLTVFERQAFSQFGEDGIIREIFERIGVTNRFFIEFGVQDGLECNSTLLLHDRWKGVWFEPDEACARRIESTFSKVLARGVLQFRQTSVDAENVESLFNSCAAPAEFDLLSIDIDGDDYWVWKAIVSFKPRVVVIEYNSTFPPPVRWVRPYDPAARWAQDSSYSASLKSLELLGRAKGYSLVGCGFAGVNAFFVRDDLVGELFETPFTAEHHYEPPRFFLARKPGHPRRFQESADETSD